jgi:membrane-associated phospholipid phosphatase
VRGSSRLRDRQSRWFPALAGAGALAIAAVSARGRGQALDRKLYRALNRDSGSLADRFFSNVTELGSIWASVGATVALFRARRTREAIDALGAAATMWLLGQALKKLWRRPRPYRSLDGVRLLIAEPAGTTWPSSHPAVLLAFVSVATRNLDAPYGVKASVAGLAGTVGFSRIYLGVHYPSDVAGGLLLGRGVADLWTAFVSPRILGRRPSVAVPGTVTG